KGTRRSAGWPNKKRLEFLRAALLSKSRLHRRGRADDQLLVEVQMAADADAVLREPDFQEVEKRREALAGIVEGEIHFLVPVPDMAVAEQGRLDRVLESLQQAAL